MDYKAILKLRLRSGQPIRVRLKLSNLYIPCSFHMATFNLFIWRLNGMHVARPLWEIEDVVKGAA